MAVPVLINGRMRVDTADVTRSQGPVIYPRLTRRLNLSARITAGDVRHERSHRQTGSPTNAKDVVHAPCTIDVKCWSVRVRVPRLCPAIDVQPAFRARVLVEVVEVHAPLETKD